MDSPIQELFEFIMSNVWVLVIIAGFIFNTIKRFNSGDSEPTTQVPLPKQFNPFDQETKQEKEVAYESTYKNDAEPEVVPDSNVSNPFYDRYLELQQKGTYSEKGNVTEDIEEPVLTISKPIDTTEPKVIKNFSTNKVVEGIIWSEILGPPRAKRPFQTRR
ncbi:hypothetical protein [Ferdinandcohnia sp. Marseille-Q9671]